MSSLESLEHFTIRANLTINIILLYTIIAYSRLFLCLLDSFYHELRADERRCNGTMTRTSIVVRETWQDGQTVVRLLSEHDNIVTVTGSLMPVSVTLCVTCRPCAITLTYKHGYNASHHTCAPAATTEYCQNTRSSIPRHGWLMHCLQM